MIEIKQYNVSTSTVWDEFVLSAKNGHFMFCRGYMDYHSDRFKDNSLMFFKEGQLVGLMPANIVDDVLYSHQGLTFGGIISDFSMTTPLMISIFDHLIEYLKNLQIKKLIYKQIPYIYSKVPAQEDQYILYNKGASLFRVDVSSSIDLANKIDFSSRRRRGVKKAENSELKVIKSLDYQAFYQVLTEVLKAKHGTEPTHSLSEIELLVSRFPDNIQLYTTIDSDNQLLAAVLIFQMKNWAHAQYIVSSEKGREVGALDLLFGKLINNVYKDMKFFDFGISTESQGKTLNYGLITQKEEFGARAIVHNFFELNL